MYLIGLTGNIACGKSTVVAMLHDLGAAVCDADAVVHAVQAPGGVAYHAIVETFGDSILSGGVGSPIDRAALGRLVFSNPQQLRHLEGLVHPAVRSVIFSWVEDQIAAGAQVAVIDAIKLIESGYPEMCDAVWVVTATVEQQLARLISERGMSEADARARIAAQNPQAAKIALADVVIDNSGTLEQTRAQVQAAYSRVLEHSRPLG